MTILSYHTNKADDPKWCHTRFQTPLLRSIILVVLSLMMMIQAIYGVHWKNTNTYLRSSTNNGGNLWKCWNSRRSSSSHRSFVKIQHHLAAAAGVTPPSSDHHRHDMTSKLPNNKKRHWIMKPIFVAISPLINARRRTNKNNIPVTDSTTTEQHDGIFDPSTNALSLQQQSPHSSHADSTMMTKEDATTYVDYNHDQTNQQHSHSNEEMTTTKQQPRDSNQKNNNEIQVSASMVLPFSRFVAYDSFVDLSKQSLYTPWLHNVEYVNGTKHTIGSITKWKLSYLGLHFTWNAISTIQDRYNGIIAWKSITGLQNHGCVNFYNTNNNHNDDISSSTSNRDHSQLTTEDDNSCIMNMTMSITIPPIASRLMLFTPQKLITIIEQRIIQRTIQNFKNHVILELEQQQEEQNIPKS